jgi:hypothetical protein
MNSLSLNSAYSTFQFEKFVEQWSPIRFDSTLIANKKDGIVFFIFY